MGQSPLTTATFDSVSINDNIIKGCKKIKVLEKCAKSWEPCESLLKVKKACQTFYRNFGR